MLSLYSRCRNAGDPHFFGIALVGTPWRVGSRAMNHMNPMSFLRNLPPSSRKRIRSYLSASDDEGNDHVCSDDEHESSSSKKPEIPVNYPRFIVFKPVYSDQPLTKLSPFAVAKSIQGRFGTVNQVKKMKDGSLLIEASRNIQAKHLLDTHSFLDIDVDADAHHSLNTSKGVIRDYHQDLRDMTDEEIKKELESQGVTKVSRFILKKDNKEIKTNTLFLNFDSHKPPEKLKIGYYIVNVQPYVPNPLRCFQCQKFGHSKKWCKNQLTCWKCGSEGHDGGDCTAETVCCLNCKGDHYASSKSCPVWIQEKEIQRVKTEKSLSYGEARKIVTSSSTSPSVTTSYASAARSATKKVSVDCQTPEFWIGPQPSLLEASYKPSVQTASTGSGTHESTTSSNIQHKTSTRKSSPVKPKKQAPPKSQNKVPSNKEVIKESSKHIETGNKYQHLSSDLSEDMDTTQSPRPARSKSRSRSRTKNISPIKHQ